MRKGALLALSLFLPATASAYTVTTGAGAVGERASTFAEFTLPSSRFAERKEQSGASVSSGTSTFGLKNMDAQTRTRTETALSELGARQEGERIIVNLPSDVLFDFDKSDIRTDARPVLARLAEALQALADTPVAIIGHTDAKGSDAYNLRLSERRAAAVRHWLSDSGVNARMTTFGKGESTPVAPNENADGSDNPAGRQQNRRVEFIIGGG